MGWTSIHREAGQDAKTFLEREVVPGGAHEVLATHATGNAIYAAIRQVATGTVWGLVVLTEWTRGRFDFNFTYKEMSETEGPYGDECPVKILDLLSPIDNEYANDWRARCRANAMRVAA